jgi:pyrroline-5-carboxylate reductase
MIMESGKDPESLKNMVTSPGGTSISALRSLEETGIKKMFKDAIEAATNRAAEIRHSIQEKNSE